MSASKDNESVNSSGKKRPAPQSKDNGRNGKSRKSPSRSRSPVPKPESEFDFHDDDSNIIEAGEYSETSKKARKAAKASEARGGRDSVPKRKAEKTPPPSKELTIFLQQKRGSPRRTRTPSVSISTPSSTSS
eukprot:14076795-Ditylum_brightwellii.AAC.1